MGAEGERSRGYEVPTYKAPPGGGWAHFLHGNVPGHQIDFIYRPEIPAGPLTQQHFSHLSRLLRYIEPRSRSAYAFAIGNLSRDDTQYAPGHGGVGLLFGLRVRGAKDHAGRQDPPFCHAIAAVDRHLDAASLLEVSRAFYRKMLPDAASRAEGGGWYHTYLRHAEDARALSPLLRDYVARFHDLPAPGPSKLGLSFTAGEATPKRVVIVHGEREPFAVLAACAARIAAVLLASDIRWTAVSNGRDIDVPGGVSVRFVPEQEAETEGAGTRVLRREDVPEDPEELAAKLFGAQAARGARRPALGGWRQIDGSGSSSGRALEKAGATGSDVARRSRAQVGVLVGLGLSLVLGGAIAAVIAGAKGPVGEGAPSGAVVAASTTSVGGEKVAPVPAVTTAEAPVVVPEAPPARSEGARSASVSRAAPRGNVVKGSSGTGKKKEPPSIFEVP